MGSCAIIPKVLNKEGKKVDSKLFSDLLSYLPNNRAEVVRIYQITKNPDFIQDWLPKLAVDSNGEPTVRSMLQKTNLSKFVDEMAVLKKLNRDIGYFKKGMDRPALWIKNAENYKKLTDKARKFNFESPFRDEYVARVISIADTESFRTFFGVRVEKRNKLNSLEAKQMDYNASLNEKLRDILAAHGVSIGTLTELEERLGANGVTDFSQAEVAANGMIEMIRLAEGIKGEKALPEEFAHFALEALGSNNPLVTRLINLLVDKGLVQEILGEDYEQYQQAYKGDEVRLAKEAAGKLLAKHLLQAETIPAKPYKNLLQRIISSIKNFFKGLSASSIQKAMKQADRDFGKLARDILDGSIDDQIDIKNITESEEYFSLAERVERDKQLLQGIINGELKRLKIYESRTANANFTTSQKALITDLESKLALNNTVEGIYTFIEEAMSTLQQLSDRLVRVQNTPGTNINQKAKVLRDIRNYLYSYRKTLDDIRGALIDEEAEADNRYGQRVRTALDKAETLLDDMFKKYEKVGMPLFIDFLKPFVGDGLVVPYGKWKGRKITADELAKSADSDISFFDRWLDSMADSSSYVLKIFDQAVKTSKENARLKTIEVEKKLAAATIQLEQAGVRSVEWMYERDDEGNLTGNYISDINWGNYYKAREKMYAALRDKYGKNPSGKALIEFNNAVRAWYAANVDVIAGQRTPKKSIYGNKEFDSLSPEKKKYYDTVMDIKKELDALLPDNCTTLRSAVKIRKDLVERVKASDGVKSGAKSIWENIKDQFIRRSDDTFIGTRSTIKDFEGNEVQKLPIYFLKMKEGENMNDLSTDIVGTLTAYAAMANDFAEMNKVIDVLELGRDMLRDHLKINKTRGEKPLVEKFTSMGRKVESKVLKSKDDRRIIERLNDWFEMQVYGRYLADEGTFGKTKIDKAKVANFANRMTSLNSLALNVLSGVSNVATGRVMMRIESFCKQFFSERDTIKADKIYAAEMPAFLGEFGKRVKTSKLALWSELFNVMQEYEQDVREINFNRKTRLSRTATSSALFFMNNAGEHWMQHRTSLALANRYKMKGPNGEIVSLWDAMEVVYIDPSNKALGAKLQVRDGFTKMDGTEFTKEDIIRFSRKSAAINQRLHGIYNMLDRNAIQRLAIGRMGIMFRKWIKPSLNRRFKSLSYNFDLEEWTEGYYRTTGRFIWQTIKELKEGKFALIANWKNLDEREKANIIRAATEVGHLVAIAAIIALISWPDDKKNTPWFIKMLEYQLRRLYTEVGSQVPGPTMLYEGLRIIKSPAAAVNTIENTIDLVGLLNPWNYEWFNGEDALMKSGRYKGESKAIKLFFESPLIPMNRTIYRAIHPEEGIPFFKQ